MNAVYTKNGRPLRRQDDDLFSRSGKHVARLKGDRAFGPDGRYVGTFVNDRLVYRSTHSARVSSPYAPRASAGHSLMNRVGSAMWGDEPPIPD